MRQYLDLLQRVLDEGVDRPDRTGTGTRSLFSQQLRFDLAAGFPLLTTKRLHVQSIFAELVWMLSGSTNVKDLQAMGCTIWDEWADANGELGPVYGKQWRSWPNHEPIDQIANLIARLKIEPFGRRHIVTAWNPAEIADMALPPCHMTFQFCVREGRLSCHLLMRSADIFLGVPFNIASYAALTHLIGREVYMKPGELVVTMVDCHLYHNHFDQAREQLAREPRALPELTILNRTLNIFSIRPEHLIIEGYDPHPNIKAPVAV